MLPLAFVGAMFLGDGLLTLQGYQSGDSGILLNTLPLALGV
jgi:hypothetical protein